MHIQEINAAAHVVTAAARLWACAGELLTAGAILWTLDTVARVIRATYRAAVATYRAGRWCGRLWFRDLLPLLLLAAKGCRSLWRRIDWPAVFRVCRAVVVLVIVAVPAARLAVINGSAALGARYAAWVTRNDAPPAAAPVAPLSVPEPAPAALPPAPPAAAPVAPLPATVAALRSLARRRGFPNAAVNSARKAELIALLA